MFIAKEFLTIGNNVYLGQSLLANHLWDKRLTIKEIIIEDNTVISDGCCITPGTLIKNGVSIFPLSITAKNDILNPGKYYFGAPLNEFSYDNLDKLFNFKPKNKKGG